MNRIQALFLSMALLFPALAFGEEIGSVSTVFKLLGSNDKIVIEAFDDPKVAGVSCHISRAKKGGIKGSIGLAEDPSNASIACRQVGPIHFEGELIEGDEVFSKNTSILFKALHVVRFFDKKRHTLVYLAYSDKLIDGSAKNSLSTVPIMPWKR
ncbi:MAG: CreA family protein [Magnetococcales bacterium]|nr:CreA family protein [Magnetococcales bacterium]